MGLDRDVLDQTVEQLPVRYDRGAHNAVGILRALLEPPERLQLGSQLGVLSL